jgi:hypothetical protein
LIRHRYGVRELSATLKTRVLRAVDTVERGTQAFWELNTSKVHWKPLL